MRPRPLIRFGLMLAVVIPALWSAVPASANMSRLTLHRRSCNGVTVYAVHDGFSNGSAPYYAVFAADLDGDGNYGEAGEPKVFKQVKKTGSAVWVSARLYFRASEGSDIAITVYEVDSTGTLVTPGGDKVKYTCANRVALDPIPGDTGAPIPVLKITAKVVVEKITVYAEASSDSTVLGGVGIGQLLNVKARNQRGDWVQVEFNGGMGWIMWQTQAYLLGPYRDLPIQ